MKKTSTNKVYIIIWANLIILFFLVYFTFNPPRFEKEPIIIDKDFRFYQQGYKKSYNTKLYRYLSSYDIIINKIGDNIPDNYIFEGELEIRLKYKDKTDKVYHVEDREFNKPLYGVYGKRYNRIRLKRLYFPIIARITEEDIIIEITVTKEDKKIEKYKQDIRLEIGKSSG